MIIKSYAPVEELSQQFMDRPIAIDLFSGVGGLSLGLELAGFFLSSFVEIDETASRYHEYNFPASRGFGGSEHGNIRNITGADLLSKIPNGREVALIAGGPPCQGFSFAGKKNPNDPLNDLVLEMARIILEVSPQSFLIENVPGIKAGQIWQLDEALRKLSSMYSISAPTTLYAPEFGVPQNRKRVFVIGIRRDLNAEPKLPFPTHALIKNGQLPLGYERAPTVREAIGDIPDVDRFPSLINGDEISFSARPKSPFQELMRGDYLMIERGYKVAWEKGKLTNCRRTQHGDDLTSRLSGLLPGTADEISGIKRLHPDEISVTIRAGTTSERGSWSAPRPCHYSFSRVLTTRECARIQSFPDWFRFHPVKWHGNRQVGNAVPPLLARAVGKSILQSLRIQRTPSAKRIPLLRRKQDLIQNDILAAETSRLDLRRLSHKVVGTRQRPPDAPRRKVSSQKTR